MQNESKVDQAMERVEREIGRVVASVALQVPVALKPFGETLGAYLRRPGKRVRARLCLAGEALCSSAQNSPGAVSVAAALELIHAFLLIHDDVMDQADVRRGAPALHVSLRPDRGPQRKKVGEDLAIVAGDWLYTVAMREVLNAPGLNAQARVAIADMLLDVCAMTAQGQALDVVNGISPMESVTADRVLETYRLKTARYTFEAPLIAGAMMGDPDEECLDALRAFSKSAGVAFQLVDDMLGLFASDEQLGKPAVSDLAEGKKTWILLRAYDLVGPADRAWLANLVAEKNAGAADLERARRLVRECGAFDEAFALANELLGDAHRHLSSFPESAARRKLVSIVEAIETAAGALNSSPNLSAQAQ